MRAIVLLEWSFGQAGVAQLVEQLIRNQQVVRSIRIAGSIFPRISHRIDSRDCGRPFWVTPGSQFKESTSVSPRLCCVTMDPLCHSMAACENSSIRDVGAIAGPP